MAKAKDPEEVWSEEQLDALRLTRSSVADRAQELLEMRVIARAWKDDEFRRELLRDPKAVAARELGIAIPDGVEIEIHEESPTTLHVVLPMNPIPQAADLSGAEFEARTSLRQALWGGSGKKCDTKPKTALEV